MRYFENIFKSLSFIYYKISPCFTEDLKIAHRYSIKHKSKIIKDNICGCFYCLKTFEPEIIKFWLENENEDGTALCPYCGIDSVIGESSDFPINIKFLKKMNKYWFSKK